MKLLLENWRRFLKEENVIGYHGSKNKISDFNISKTNEFGFHFGLDEEQAQHRIDDDGFLYKVRIKFEKPLEMEDLGRWSLQSVLERLDFGPENVKGLRDEASSRARESGRSMRVEENIVLSEFLNDNGYDAITYDNRGESGGRAVIIWNPEQLEILDVSGEKTIFYHGTARGPEDLGEYISPPEEHGLEISEKGGKKNLDKVFFTKDLGSAKIYARRAVNSYGGDPHIYVVEPVGDIETINPTRGTTVFAAPRAKIIDEIH
jgi:hypothetical protein